MTKTCKKIFGVVVQFTLYSFSVFCFLHSEDSISQISVPTGFTAKAYDSHVELNWNANPEPSLSSYRIFRKDSSGNDSLIVNLGKLNKSYIDYMGREDRDFQYTISATNNSAVESEKSLPISATTFEMSDDELLTMVQEYTFRYFWEFAHPFSGLARERNTSSTVTIGGSGFGIMSIISGIERGFISKQQGLERLLKITDFLLNKADRFHGVFPHWLNGTTGKTIAFSTKDNGADLVETAFLIQGLLTVRSYFDHEAPDEVKLRSQITQIWEEVEWSWFRRGSQNVLYWHWSPNFGWDMNHRITGFNEAHIVYLLAAMSPTYSIPASVYHQGWVSPNYKNGNSYYGIPLSVGSFRGGPLFFAHYSYLGFDPRGIKDNYANYFSRNINHSLINWSYAKENPKNYKAYSEKCWGLTASDNPFGYLAHEPTNSHDNGTITPTAALSSFPYTPMQSMDALKCFYRDFGKNLWGIYGFYDAFNVQHNWFATSYLAIDQGPIIIMIENYRTQLFWNLFMKNPEVQPMLNKLGFVPDTSIVSVLHDKHVSDFKVEIYPNPVSTGILTVQLNNFQDFFSEIKMDIFTVEGNAIEKAYYIIEDKVENTQIQLDVTTWKQGIYFLRFSAGNKIVIKKVIIYY